MKRTLAVAAAAAVLAGCGGNDASTTGDVTLRYTLWVDAQLPAYQKCADGFHAKHPKVTVKLSQTAWGQYWQNLTTQLVSGTAPDVFTDSVAYYPEYSKNGQILDIEPYVKRDRVDLGRYRAGLPELWVRDGKRFGLPKDWDTIALIVNTDLLAEAGVDPATLSNLSWNPTDGGEFERLVARLTVDADGRRGDQPGFDRSRVKTRGLVVDLAAGAMGQTSWGNFAVSNGFTFTDKNPFGTKYQYDDRRFVDTIAWFNGLQGKGFIGRYDQRSSLGTDAVLESGSAAIGITGSWMAKTYLASTKRKYAFVPLPVGPAGRKSAINGLSDAIYAGTKHKEEAWEWVKYLASADCQDVVAGEAVVFPAITTSTALALTAFQQRRQDVHVFVDTATAPGGTFLLPLTDHSGQVGEIVQTALDTVWLGQASPADALRKANADVNALFK